MANLDGLYAPYFYLHLPVIHELGGLDTFCDIWGKLSGNY